MTDARPEIAVVRVALVVGSEPLRGDLIDASGRPTPFAGWMELARLLEDVHHPDAEGPPHAR
jgi:hypothetical protein